MIDKALNKGIDVAHRRLDQAHAVALKLHRKVPARYWIATGALIGAIVAGCIAGYLQRDFGKRNLEYQPWPDMSISKAAESQMVYGRAEGDKIISPLPRGATDLLPPEGTVYAGQQFYDLAAKEIDKAKPRTSPIAGIGGADRDAALARGKEVFMHVCQACHGVDGIGQAPVTLYGVPAPTIANKLIRDRYTDGELFHIITHGTQNGNMPAHAAHVKIDDRWKVILYLRKLQQEARE